MKSIESGNFFFQPAQLHLEPPDLFVQLGHQRFLLLALTVAIVGEQLRRPFHHRRFHCPICVAWTPKVDASWLVVRSPRTAANAAFAFTPASIRRRFAPMLSSKNWTYPTWNPT